MIKFETGKTYETRFIGGHNLKVTFEVIKRTKSFVTVKEDGDRERRCKVYNDNEYEYCYPYGRYSKCLVLTAR